MPNPTGNLAQEGHINARLCFWVRAEAKEPQHTHTNDHVIKVQSFFLLFAQQYWGIACNKMRSCLFSSHFIDSKTF